MTIEYFVKRLLARCTKTQWHSYLRDMVMELKSSQRGVAAEKLAGYIRKADEKFRETAPPKDDADDDAET